MKIKLILGASILLLVSVQAEASIYEYTYTGNTLFADVSNGPDFSDPLDAFNGIMRINENALDGGTLVNTNITLFALNPPIPGDPSSSKPSPFGPIDVQSEVDGLLAYDILPFPSLGGSTIQFTTDINRNIISWALEAFIGDNIQGIFSDPRGDEFTQLNGVALRWRTAEPGSWQVSVVPIPAAIWLFGTAMIGLVGFSKRRKAA